LTLKFPDQPELRASHEATYRAIYLQTRGNLRGESKLQKALRSRRARRRALTPSRLKINERQLNVRSPEMTTFAPTNMVRVDLGVRQGVNTGEGTSWGRLCAATG
jgi:hypothetical protein